MRTPLVVVCALSAVAGAKGGKAPKQRDLAPIVAALEGVDDEAAGKAAGELGEATESAAHDALLDALALGLRAPVAVEAIGALAHHPAPPDVLALKRYAGHRNPSVRGAALAALATYPDPVAKAAVVAGLHDMNAGVRGTAAASAAKGKVREAYDTLFDLLGRGEEPAARALANLADAELVRRIGDQLGKVPDVALAQCLGFVLKRNELPDPVRVDVVRAVAKIQDVAAVHALQDYVDATPKNPPRPSRQEAEKILEARGGK